MTVLSLHENEQQLPELQGHLVGFAGTYGECAAICHALIENGFDDSEIKLLCGNDGIHVLIRILSGSTWGETPDEVLRQGLIELDRGHWVLIINVLDREHALAATNIATPLGGYGFTYFGVLVDERLTN